MNKIFLVFVVFLFAVTAYAVDDISGSLKVSATGDSLTNMTGRLSNGMSLGYVKVGTTEAMLLSWKPDFKYGPWGIGLDVNIPVGDQHLPNLETVVVRYAEYNDGKKGLRYGVLDGITYGQGLLMKNYTTRIAGPVYLDNQQMGVRGFYNTPQWGLDTMATWSHVYAVRVIENVHPMLTLGQTYVSDADGKQILQPDGTVQQFPSVAGMAVDASVPLPWNFKGYAEAAQLNNYGRGFTVGVDWGAEIFLASLAFNAGYRLIDNNFVPGYFNEDYETNPVNIGSYEASGKQKNGYLVELKGVVADITEFRAAYEAYDGSNATLNADLAAAWPPVTLSAYYTQPNFVDFRSLTLEEGAVIGARIGYKVNPYTNLVTHYKKAFNPTTGQVEETQMYEVEINF
ncbi:MAG: hypothetical protein ABIB65_03240 [Candidatus Margulisiibacteriota bacterium]